MTIIRQLTLSLPDFDVDEQLDIFPLLPAELDGVPVKWSTPTRDLATWSGMAHELAERLPDFVELTTMVQGLVIGHALAATTGTMTLAEYLESAARFALADVDPASTTYYARRFAHFIASEALALTDAFGVDK